MQSLNYHHLLYFWLAAKKGGVTAAARELNLAQPTISGQIRQLETALGSQLFTRAGRGLQLTEVGRTVYSYADEIFSIGEELVSVLQQERRQPQRVVLGVSRQMPRLLVARLLAVRVGSSERFVLRELSDDAIGTELRVHAVDAVLTDHPPDPKDGGRALPTLLGEAGISWFGPRGLAETGKPIEQLVAETPLVLPLHGALRRSVDAWLTRLGLTPNVTLEAESPDLLPAVARDSGALLPAAEVLGAELADLYDLAPLGAIPDAREQYWVIAADRRFQHGALPALLDAAHGFLDQPQEAAAAQ